MPRTGDVRIGEALDEFHVPKIAWRRFAWFHLIDALRRQDAYDPRTERLAFSRHGLRNFWQAYSLTHPQDSLYSPIRANTACGAPSVLAKQAAVLKEALKTAPSHPLPEFAERVKFLQAGLEHARLSARFMGTLDRGKVPTDRDGFLKSQQALHELIAFRRAKEHLFISDYLDAAAYRERRNVKGIDRLFENAGAKRPTR